MTAERIAKRLVDHANELEHEIHAVSDLFRRTRFLDNPANMPYAHFGYLMATLGLVDTLSLCDAGSDNKKQTPRMCSFLDAYVHPGQVAVHPVLVQMMRHTLMHTGALRYLYDPTSKVAYTWRVHFGELDAGVTHYTVTSVDPVYQDELHELAKQIGVSPMSITALNISLTAFAADVVRGACGYVAAMLADPGKRARAETEFPGIEMQQKSISPRGSSTTT